AGSRQALTRSGDAWSGTLDVPRTGFPLLLPLTLTLDLVTKPNLLRLAPVAVQTTVMVEPPASLPSVGPARLVLPDVVGAGDTRGTLQVRGSDQGPTEVCLGQPRLHGPPQGGEFAVSTGRRCVALARDERTSVTLTVDPSGKADGLVEGTLPVALRGSRPNERARLDVPVQFGMRRPVDEATRWELVALLVVVGMVVPLLVLWAAGRQAARLRFDVFTVADIPVVVTENGLRRAGEDTPLRLDPEDFVHQPPPDELRCPLTTEVELRARTPARSFFAPETVVEATDGQLVAGQHDERPVHRRRMRIPLGQPAAWLLVCDDPPPRPSGADGQLPARLVAYRTQDGPESLSLLQQSLDGFGRWDRVLGGLRRQAPQEAATATGSGHTQSVPDHDPPPDFL
ncbi:MAG TPA: hypothetical protein VKP64_00980, partial [Mycobacteriales bacterium]|nr:hypothetical protein [Mycobacteriales bacterium]